ncbi:MAG: hypothetical protein Q8P42_16010, partial [Gallionella sp.]|nr:hypothetical protein [Gallionella sp.]
MLFFFTIDNEMRQGRDSSRPYLFMHQQKGAINLAPSSLSDFPLTPPTIRTCRSNQAVILKKVFSVHHQIIFSGSQRVSFSS